MPTLFVVEGHRICIYVNDHGPAHVHAVGGGHAKFVLGGGPADVRLVEVDGIGVATLRRIARAIAGRCDECLEAWESIHG